MPNFPEAPDSAEPALPPSPQHPVTPPEINGSTWDFAARRLLAKMLGEFAYEEIVSPVPTPSAAGDAWTLTLDDGGHLGFRARRRSYGSWQVAPDTITLTPPPPPRRPRPRSGTRTSSLSAPALSSGSTERPSVTWSES